MITTFGQRLAIARKSQGLSRSGLAKKSGVHSNTIYLWETGVVEPSLSVATCVATALNVSLDWLVGMEDTIWIDMLLENYTIRQKNWKK